MTALLAEAGLVVSGGVSDVVVDGGTAASFTVSRTRLGIKLLFEHVPNNRARYHAYGLSEADIGCEIKAPASLLIGRIVLKPPIL